MRKGPSADSEVPLPSQAGEEKSVFRTDGASPDTAEEEAADEMENGVPARGHESHRLVGLGGSAGSIPALQEFFHHMRPAPGMAFVVVLHLSPEHESLLPELLQRATPMKVQEAQDGMRVELNQVYVIPPGKFLTSIDGSLRLTPLNLERGRRAAVDLFFRTLADTHGPNAVAVVLSGADGDGAIGIKRIKERGGLAIVQDPEEAEHPGMPCTSIATGMVDWILKVADMPAAIESFVERQTQLVLPSEEDGPSASDAQNKADEHEENLRNVLAYLRTSTGRDFSSYKRATILRRISRRMQVNGVVDLCQYLKYLRTHSGEASALLQDLLISVTNFFRDSDCFEALATRIPDLFIGKSSSDTVRVWVAACATGEEAYSIAMLLCEHARKLDSPPILQVFATDLDAEAIKAARSGLYPETIAADVNEVLLGKYFTKDHQGFRVKREIREMILFAVHDILRDSPFCRLDLVSCRNLLIYLNKDAQRKVMDVFHFALRPGGRLFLGSCEAPEDGSAIFEVLDKKKRIYARRHSSDQRSLPLTAPRSFEGYVRGEGIPNAERPAVSGAAGHPHAPLNFVIPGREGKEQRLLSYSELHYKLIEHVSPPSILVTLDHEIVHLSENAGKFLQPSGGEPTRNLLRAVHPMLRIELRAAFNEAGQTGQTVEIQDIPFEFEGRPKVLNIRISPAHDIDAGLLVVVFDLRDSPAPAASPVRREPEPMVRQLEREMESTRTYLKGVVEQYEVSTEELKASNEELQAMNEELRSPPRNWRPAAKNFSPSMKSSPR